MPIKVWMGSFYLFTYLSTHIVGVWQCISCRCTRNDPVDVCIANDHSTVSSWHSSPYLVTLFFLWWELSATLSADSCYIKCVLLNVTRLMLASKHRRTSLEPMLSTRSPCFWTGTQLLPSLTPNPTRSLYVFEQRKIQSWFGYFLFSISQATVPGLWMGCVYFKLT